MCLLWKKVYLCGCSSHLFRERCTACLRSGGDNCDHPQYATDPRKSHFKCYDCLKDEDIAEKQAVINAAMESAKKAEEQRKKEAEKARLEKIRRDAELRAQRERDEEARIDRDKKAEMERAKREGGPWVESGSTKKGKGRKGSGQVNMGFSTSSWNSASAARGFKTGAGVFAPLVQKEKELGASILSTPTIIASNVEEKDNVVVKDIEIIKANGVSKDNGVAKANGVVKDKSMDPGGRAGIWGRKSGPKAGAKSPPKSPPKRILKPENPSGKKA